MCGIIYVKRKDGLAAAKTVIRRYHAQKHRGQEGFGYVAVKNNKVVSYKRSPVEHEILEFLKQEDADEILFHHRFPTSTPNIAEAAHPILVNDEKKTGLHYFIAHNGVIRNDDELYAKHSKAGWEYSTEIMEAVTTKSGKVYETGKVMFNDSEALAIDVALVLEGKQKNFAAVGTVAVIGLSVDTEMNVITRFLLRNDGNPLKYHEDKTLTAICSEGIGEDVTQNFVQMISHEGKIQKFPIPIITPYEFEYERNRSHTYSIEDEEDYRELGFGRPDIPPRTVQPLIGKVTITPKEGDAMKHISEQIDILDKLFPPTDEELQKTMKLMGEADLWIEFENAQKKEDEIQASLTALDKFIDQAGTISDKALERAQELEGQLLQVQRYKAAIDKELTIRESAQEGILLQ